MSKKQTVNKGSSAKAGRNSSKCNNYRLMSRRIANGKRRLERHLGSNINDKDAKKAFKLLSKAS